MNNPKISVIVPVYNVQRYIEQCARSLFEQTLEDIEFIFVNDCSSDNTIFILKNIAKNYPNRNIQIIHHDINKGVSAARATGLIAATGEYVIHCDSDDWVDIDYYETMYYKAISCDADIVVSDYIEEYPDRSVKCDTPDLKNWEEFKHYSGWLFLALWNRLVRRSLIAKHKLDFYKGINCAEDLGFMLRVYFFSKVNVKSRGAFYHYRKGIDNSISQKAAASVEFKDQSRKCVEFLCMFLKENKETPIDCNPIRISMMNVKEAYLSVRDFKKWKVTFPEITPYFVRDAPPRTAIVWLLGQYVNCRVLKLLFRISDMFHNNKR